MMPTVEDICIKDVKYITINDTLEDAIKVMSNSEIRSVLVKKKLESNLDFYIITSNDIISFKINRINKNTPLSQLNLQPVKSIDGKVSILEVLNEAIFEKSYMVVTLNNELIGIISQTDIINNIDPEILIEKQTIGNVILNYKPFFINENYLVIDAIKLMDKHNIDALIIVNDDENPVGIFTTKDFLDCLKNNCDLEKEIKYFMSAPLETIEFDVSISQALEFVQKKHFKRLVVVDNGKLSGVITQTELLRIINNRWVGLIKEKGRRLSTINEELLKKTIQLEEIASHDYLTNLYNRSKLDAMLNYEIHQVRRYSERNLSLLLFDIDDFKRVNDNFGHDVGDKILQKMAHLLTMSSRESDIVSRWGGEEFLMMLPETNIEQAIVVAEKIRFSIENTVFTNDLRITCSIGVSQYRTSDSIVSLFKRVDEALYDAKHSGKNQVKIERPYDN